MSRPTRRSTLAKLFLTAAALTLAGCEASRPPEENQAGAGSNVAEPTSSLPLPAPEPPLDRERLLLAVAQARSASAAGLDDRPAQSELDGKRFELRIRFGCGAPPAEAAGNPSVHHDTQARTVELDAAPDFDLGDPTLAQLAGEGVEAAEGLWLARPWLLQPACAPAADAAAQPTQRQVAIAQVFTAEDSRIGRRDDRTYRHVIRLGEGEDAARPQGYELVLSGRLRAGSGGRVIRCAAPDPAAMPLCLIGAEFDSVRFEDVERGTEIARWNRG